jgi:hypothetical protein
MIAVDDANLGAAELKIPTVIQIPSRVDLGGVVHDERLDSSLGSQFVDDSGVNSTFNWSLKTLFYYRWELAFDEHAILVARLLIP